MNVLHSKLKIAHLDLKLENILIGDDGKLKICDFGMTYSIDDLIRKQHGTKFYCAPEIHTVGDYNPYMGMPADIFSLGMILFILAFGAPPISMASNNDPNYRIFKRNPQKFWQNHPNVKKSQRGKNGLDQDLVDLLTKMLADSPQTRPQTMNDVMSHPFFTKD